MVAEVLELFATVPPGTVLDATVGGGGHALALLDAYPHLRILGLDQDPSALEAAAATLAPAGERAVVRRANFSSLATVVEEAGAAPLSGVLFDLGVSSPQLDRAERGFSHRFDAPLDMRMDPDDELSARDIVNGWDRRRLARLFREYGEERYSGPIAREIERRRDRGEIQTTQELVDAVTAAVPAPAQFAAGHPAKRVFQALRIAVNDELDQLDRALPAAWELLRPGGRLAAISFHSLEDRRVKRFLAARARGCICPPDMPVCGCGRTPEAELLTRRSVAPTPGEVAANPRAKSARLRAARRLEPDEEEGS